MSIIKYKGYFEIKRNELLYYPHTRETQSIPHVLKVTGTWQIDKNHDLAFIVDESQNHIFGRSIKFSARIENAGESRIEFSLLDRTTPALRDIHRIKLDGFWRSHYNKLAFCVQRDGARDELIFSNTWDVTERNQIIYLYTRTMGRRQITSSFLIQGRWSYRDGALTYAVENSRTSQLKFEVSAAHTLANPRLGRLDFTLGAGTSRDVRRAKAQTISLWGKWEAKECGLEFRVQLAHGVSIFSFGVNKKLSNDKEVVFSLIDERGKPLGFELAFLKKIFGDGSFFIRGKLSQEKKIEAGLYLPW